MLDVAVVEDEPADEALVLEYLGKVGEELGEELKPQVFGTAEAFLAADTTRFDVVLLDIELPGMNGVACARELRRRGLDASIVFVTNLFQFALEGYDVRAVDFLVKPLRYAGFRSGVLRAVEEARRRKPSAVEFQDGKSMRLVDATAITYVETKGRKVAVHLSGSSFVCDGPIREVAHTLEPLGFFLIHQSFLVNMAHVECVGLTDVVVAGESVPMSRHRRGEFMRAYAAYVRRVF